MYRNLAKTKTMFQSNFTSVIRNVVVFSTIRIIFLRLRLKSFQVKINNDLWKKAFFALFLLLILIILIMFCYIQRHTFFGKFCFAF